MSDRSAAAFEGASRPGHFAGVATVVLKLFQRVRPDIAVFGQKDAQQVAVIRRMVRDLDVPVALRIVPTVREPDGLAVSTRNAYLSHDERRRAPSLHRALVARDPRLVEGDLDYLAVVDPDTFEPVDAAAGRDRHRRRPLRLDPTDRQHPRGGFVKLSLPDLRTMKSERRPIVMITAYDHPTGRIVDAAGVDLVLVGDSAANVVLGHDSTVPATMDEMTILTRAVSRGVEHALVIGDLPFMSYQVSDEEAVRNAGRLVKEGGADAVKLEGAGPSLDRIRAIVASGIPVMGHLGLTPQTATIKGGHKAQGRQAEGARALFADALAVQAAGCFGVVLEAVPPQVAEAISRRLDIVTIGIGSGAGTDGQVLVLHDMLGIRSSDGPQPRFVKHYAEVGDVDEGSGRAVRDRGARRRVPGGRAHLLDAARGGRGVRARDRRRLDRGERPRGLVTPT